MTEQHFSHATKASPTEQPIRLYLEDSMSEQDQASYDLSDAEWAMVKPVDGVTTALSGEKYSTLSWCLHSCLDFMMLQDVMGMAA